MSSQMVAFTASANSGSSPRDGVAPLFSQNSTTTEHDDLSWPVADYDGSFETITTVGLAPGPHKIRFQLVDPTRQPIPGAPQIVEFTVPPKSPN